MQLNPNLNNQYQTKHPFFSGRMKTVREKHVYYEHRSTGEVFDSNRETPPIILPVLSAGGTVGCMLGGIPSLGSAVGAFAGLLFPIGATVTAFLQDRKVTYVENQVPMTAEEEMATMTPLEQAHFKINEALEKWKMLREPHKKQIQQLKNAIQQIEKDVQQLTLRQSTSDAEASRLESIRLKAKQDALQEHQQLLVAAEKVYEALDQQILEREEKLIQGQEKLNMMQLQQGVIQMHEQLEKVKVSKETDAQNEPIMFEMEKQRVQIETVMASIQQALDVESVLKNMTIADAAKG